MTEFDFHSPEIIGAGSTRFGDDPVDVDKSVQQLDINRSIDIANIELGRSRLVGEEQKNFHANVYVCIWGHGNYHH